MARRQSREERRHDRQRAKLQEVGIGAIVIGIVMWLLPIFVKNPVLHSAFTGLRTVAWLLIIGGIALLVLYKFTRSKPDAPRAPPPMHEPTLRPDQSARSRLQPLGGPLVDDIAALAEEKASVAMPRVPTTWSAAVFDVIEWRRFEAVCEWLFSQAGFETKTQSHGADGGIDIWLYSKNHGEGPVSVVQCKHWNNKPVKVAEMRALLGSMTDKKVKRGIFATTSIFTLDARQFAKDNGIQLLDRTGLLELIAKRSREQQQELLAVATKGEFWVPTCPSCGVKMTRRQRKRDASQFWGCVNFPKCMTAING